jgi:hypothetical protein
MATKKRDYCEVLGVGRNASEERVRRAYRKQAFVIPSEVQESLSIDQLDQLHLVGRATKNDPSTAPSFRSG